MATITINKKIIPPKRSTIEEKVLKKLTPNKKLPNIIIQTISKVEKQIKKGHLKAVVKIGGSIAKGTYLKEDHDIDIFVRFSSDYNDEKLSEYLERVLKKCFSKIERVHGSRDYFHVIQGGFTFEFIPVSNINSWQEAKNVTDMSPLHVEYVHSRLKDKPWLAQDIRLTKQFCKSAKIYGAESYIGGFSGHVIDLLIIHYGGFRELLKAAASWPAKVVLDPESSLNSPLEQLNSAKIYAPLIIVDPVQQNRNSSAAISKEAFEKFKKRAKEYLIALNNNKNQESFFIITQLSESQFANEHHNSTIISLTLTPQIGKKDVIGAKCLKVYKYCAQQLTNNSFIIDSLTWQFTPKQAIILFAISKNKLSKNIELQGPPVHKTNDVANYKKKHKTTLIKHDRLYAIEKRKYTDPIKLLKSTIKNNYVTKRVKKCSMKEINKNNKP